MQNRDLKIFRDMGVAGKQFGKRKGTRGWEDKRVIEGYEYDQSTLYMHMNKMS
jgi:hypothetical protein